MSPKQSRPEIHGGIQMPEIPADPDKKTDKKPGRNFGPGDEEALLKHATKEQLKYLTKQGAITGFVSESDEPASIRALPDVLKKINDPEEIRRMKVEDTRDSSQVFYDRRLRELQVDQDEDDKKAFDAEKKHAAKTEQEKTEGREGPK